LKDEQEVLLFTIQSDKVAVINKCYGGYVERTNYRQKKDSGDSEKYNV
jgi:hypothetical protein